MGYQYLLVHNRRQCTSVVHGVLANFHVIHFFAVPVVIQEECKRAEERPEVPCVHLFFDVVDIVFALESIVDGLKAFEAISAHPLDVHHARDLEREVAASSSVDFVLDGYRVRRSGSTELSDALLQLRQACQPLLQLVIIRQYSTHTPPVS
jgi:hypothetical protein